MSEEIPEIYFCGCLNQVGHFIYNSTGKQISVSRNKAWPWKFLDSSELHPNKHGNAWLTHKEGWTALGIGDQSVDNRSGSHSTFVIQGIYDFSQTLYFARMSFPNVVDRIGLITLVEVIEK